MVRGFAGRNIPPSLPPCPIPILSYPAQKDCLAQRGEKPNSQNRVTGRTSQSLLCTGRGRNREVERKRRDSRKQGVLQDVYDSYRYVNGPVTRARCWQPLGEQTRALPCASETVQKALNPASPVPVSCDTPIPSPLLLPVTRQCRYLCTNDSAPRDPPSLDPGPILDSGSCPNRNHTFSLHTDVKK